MFSFIGAVVQHMIRIVTLRHPGTGLPATRGGALYVLMFLWAVSRMSFEATLPVEDSGGFNALNSVAYVIAYLGVAVVFLRPTAVALLTLVDTFTNLIAIGLRFSGVTSDVVYVAVDIWGCIALIVTMSRYVSSAIQADRKNTPKKN
jgi:hypothetical protein